MYIELTYIMYNDFKYVYDIKYISSKLYMNI